jgi:hypothetical protein
MYNNPRIGGRIIRCCLGTPEPVPLQPDGSNLVSARNKTLDPGFTARLWFHFREGLVKFMHAAAVTLIIGALALPTEGLLNAAAASPMTSRVSHNYTPLPGHPPTLRHPRLPPKAIKVQRNYPHDPRYGPH